MKKTSDYSKAPTEFEKQSFIDAVKRGEWLCDHLNLLFIHEDYLTALIENELYIDQLSDTKFEHIHILLKKAGIETDYYRDYLHSDERIRYEIAKNGKFPEQFIGDSSSEIVKLVLSRRPEYLPYFFHDKNYFDMISNYYATQKEPDLDQFKIFLQVNSDKIKYDERTCIVKLHDVIAIKEASYKTPNTLEKTMTPLQLYEARNPLWARTLTLDSIYEVLWKESNDVEMSAILDFLKKVIVLNY